MNEFAKAFVTFLQVFLPQDLSLSILVLLLSIAATLCLLTAIFLLLKVTDLKKQQQTTGRKLAVAEQQSAEGVEDFNNLAIREAKLVTLLTNERKHAAEKLQLLEDAREELRLQFTSLAQQIFDEKSARFSELNREKLDAILQPFNIQLTSLKQEINEVYRNDSRERLSLKHEIIQLRDLNQQVNQEAINLTKALKSDTKIQGN